jgi:CRISPR-associated endonuclease Cas3-HD
MQTLSAKSGTNAPTLEQHTRDVVAAAEALFGTATDPRRLGGEWLRFYRLDSATDMQRFRTNLLAAALFHDWGKANSDMQAVFGGKGNGQLFRHEHLSVLLLGHDGVDRWVRQRTDIDWDVVIAAVGSHHLMFSHTAFAPENADKPPVRVYLDHADFRDRVLPLTSERLGLTGSPTFPKQGYWGFCDDAATFDPTQLRDRLKNKRLRDASTAADQRMLRAVLITANAAGSELHRTGLTVGDWICGQFDERELCDHATIRGVIDSRVAGRGSSTRRVSL